VQTHTDILVRDARPADAADLVKIYNHYVLTSAITFEEAAVEPGEFERRVAEIQRIPLPWLVAEHGTELLGFAYAGKWKPRAAYRYSTEVTVYVRAESLGIGIGTRLYSTLFARLKMLGVHAVIGGVALPNEASMKLHERFGFEKVAHFKQVGFKFERWIDVTYWELIL